VLDPTGSQSATPVPPGNLLLLRDRIVILSALGIVTLLCWVYLVDMARGMDGMTGAPHCAGVMGKPWTAGYFTAMLMMWIIMMVGMMVPSAIPMALIYASVARKAARGGTPLAPTGIFVIGYVVIWSLFSLGATIARGPWIAWLCYRR
jgi:predicted metal-binding membrane protein